ncbi:MAG TPA: hypothetical protein VLE03_03685 [Nitrospiraceae bacterium]|nr:hypothetical protein [Nitrospiraceae bacterium]
MSRPRGIFLLGLSSLLLTVSGCLSPGTTEEALGLGIVRGTLGTHEDSAVRMAHPGGTEPLKGYVVTLEGGAYVLHGLDGSEHRIPLDENTRIDRPAHVGDKIEAFLDKRGRAVFIRNIDHDIDHTFQ